MQALFEQGLVYILKRVLGEFVEDSAHLQEKIQVGISNGSIILEHLVLKNSILSLVDVPISLSYGSIGKFELKIPWSKLGVDPIIVNIEKINILVEPKYEWSRGAVDKREQAVKQAKLAAAELFAAKRLVNKTRSYADFAKSWFMSSFVNKIIDNIQITVREVHFRYEDHVSCPSRFCIGFSLECLTVRTRDAELTKQMEEQFPPVVKNIYDPHAAESSYEKYNVITAGSDVFNKVIQITNLAMYWNPLVASSLDVCSCCFIGRPTADIQSFMSRTLAMGTAYIDKPRHHYLLLPVDIHTYLSVSLNTNTGAVKATVNVFMANISLTLEDRQLREIISMTTYMSNFAKLERFSEFRPTKIVAEDPKAWWRYAINAVIVQIRMERKSTLTWKQLTQRVADKLVYVALWKSRLVSPQSVINQLNTFDTTKRTLDRATNTTYQNILKRVKKEIDDSKRLIESLPTIKASGNMKVSGTLHATPMSKTSGAGSVTASHNGKNAAAANAAHMNTMISPVNVASAASLPLTKEGIELLKALEYDLSFEDIVQFRSKAEKNLSLEAKQKSWLDGLTSWVTGGKPSNDSVEEKLKLFEALKYDPDRVFRGGNQEVDLHEVMANVSVTLKKGSFTMALSTPDVNTFQSSLPFLKLDFDDLKNKNIIMGDGSHVKVFLSLHDFEAFEVVSANNMKKFVSRRTLAHDLSQSGSVVDSVNEDARSFISSSVRSLTGGARRGSPKESSAVHVSGKPAVRSTPPLFSSSIDIFPPNKEKDTAVYLTLEELEVWISPFATWFDPMMAFVTWPEDLKYWSEMEMTTLNQLADIKAVFDAKIEYMMNNHMNIVMEAKVKAPVIIITDSDFKDDTADVLVIDLGSISLKTEKLAKAQRQKLMDSQLAAAGSNASEGGSIRTSNSLPTTPIVSAASKRFSKSFRTPTVTQSIMEEENEEEEPAAGVSTKATVEEISPTPGDAKVAAHDDYEVLNASGISSDAPSTPMVTASAAHNVSSFTTPPVVELADENYRFTDTNIKGRRSSVYHRYLNADGTLANPPPSASGVDGVGNSYYGQSVHGPSTTEVDELNEEDLFDVFMCKMRDSEVYLINSALVHNVMSEIEPDKTVIVDRSEMSIEIQVSVLPWDSELPPVKLFVDMDELNIQLSEPKLLRLNQFAVGLVNRSNNIINSKSASKFANVLKKRAHDSLSGRVRTSGMGTSFLTSGGASSNLQAGSRLSTGSIYRAQRMSHKTNVDFNVPDDASTFYDAKSELGSIKPGDSERRSVASSRLSRLIEGGRHVVSDDERNSDDSFFSVEENYSTKDRVRQAESLASQIAEKEATQMKLMSNIRVTEADPTKEPLLELLKLELADCEKELKFLRIRFIELRMHTNELEQFIGQDGGRNNAAYSEAELAARRQMVDQMIFPEEGVHRHDLGHKRNLIHASVFKITQEPNQYSNADVKYKPTDEKLSEFMNKKLVYAKVNIAVVNVDLQCVTKTPSGGLSESRVLDALKSRRSSAFTLNIPVPPAERTVIFRLRLSGIHLTLKHKTMDSKVLFILHQIDLHDFSLNNSILPFNPVTTDKTGSYGLQAGATVLVSSEPSLFGMFGNPLSSKYLQNGTTDFVRVKYDVAYADTTLPADDPHNPFPVTQHNVEVTSGFLGVNVEQDKISLLLDTVTQLASQIAATAKMPSPLAPTKVVTLKDISPAVDAGNSAAQLAAELDALQSGFSSTNMLQQLPSIDVKFDLDCVSVSLLHQAAPLLTASIWQIRTSINTCMDQMRGGVQVSDVVVDYYSAASDIPVPLITRQSGCVMPFLSLEARLEVEESHVYMPNLTVLLKTVPVEMVMNLDAVHDLTKHIVHGPVYKFMNEMSTKASADRLVAVAPAPVSTSSNPKGLDGVLNPLLDFCNGEATLNIGGLHFRAPSSSEYVHSRTDFSFSVAAIDSRTAWGDFCTSNGLVSSTMVKCIDVHVSSWSLCDAFNVCMSVSMLPESLLGAFPNSSVTSPEFEFSTEFIPPKMAPVSKNEMQISVGISPIVLHCNDAVISEAITWVANTDAILQKIAALLASDAPPLNQTMADLLHSSSAPASSLTSNTPVVLGFVLNSEVLIYEVVVFVEVCRDAPPSHAQHGSSFEPRTPQRTPLKMPGHLQRADHGSSFSFLNIDANINDKVTAIFKLTSRHISIVSNIEDSQTADTDVVVDTEQLFDDVNVEGAGSPQPQEQETAIQSFLETRLTVETIDLEYLAGSHKSYKRMLCNSTLLSQSLDLVPFLSLNLEVSPVYDIQVSAVVSNVHLAVISDGIVALLALLQVYDAAANPQPIENSSRRDILTPSSKNFISGDSQSSSQGRRRGKEFRGESASMYEHSSAGGMSRSSSAQNRDQSYSHPSSVPMSTSTETAKAPNAFANLQSAPTNALPTTILHRLSFALPTPLKSIAFKANVVSMHVWLPGDGGSGSLSLCCSIDSVSVSGAHRDVHWPSFTQLKETTNESQESVQTFWTSQLAVGSLGIFLTDVVPLELTFAVPPITSERSNTHQNDKTAEYKVLMSPFDITAQFDLQLVSCVSQPTMAPLKSGSFVLIDSNVRYEVRQVVSVVIQDITAHVYLDYRPYLRLYDYVSSPLNTYFAALSMTTTVAAPAKRDHVHYENVDRLSVVQSEYTPIKAGSSKKSNISGKTQKEEELNVLKYDSLQKLLRDKKLDSVGSVFDLFAALPAVAGLTLTLQQDNISVYVINDIYVQQPVSIARLSVNDLDVTLNLFSPPRRSGLLLISNERVSADDESKKPRSDSTTSISSSSRNLFDFSLISRASGRVSDAFKDLTGSGTSGSSPSTQQVVSATPTTTASSQTDSACEPMVIIVAKSSVRIDYYNQKLIATEPLIEPFNSEIVFTMLNAADAVKKNGPLLTLLNETSVESGSSLSTTQIDTAVSRLIVEHYFPPELVLKSSMVPPPPCLQASTFGNINVNLTVALFESAFLTMKALNYLEASSASGGANLKDVSMLAIRNETGMMLKYWTKEKSHTEEVPTNSEIPLNLVEFDLDTCGLGINKECWLGGVVGSSATTARSIHVSVQRPSGQFYPSLLDIPLEGVGCRLFVLELDPPESETETEGTSAGSGKVLEKHKHRRSRPRALHQSGQRESGAELKDAISTPNSTIVALELISKAGIKTLLIRSTMRLYNSTRVAFKVELVSGYRNIKREVLWESIIPPGNGIAVPAHLCNVENGRFIVKPSFDFSKSGSQWAQQYYRVSSQRNVVFSAELPVPAILGSTNAHNRVTQDENDDYQDGNNYIFNERDDALPRNFIMWRKLHTQNKSAAETLSYSHWVRFNKNNTKSTDHVHRNIEELVTYCQEKSESVCCNVNVESRGIPQLSKTRSSESCLLRTLVFAPSITVTNLMAHGIEVAITPNISKYTGKIANIETLFKSNRNLLNIIPSAQLKPSESWDCVSYHSSEKILLSLKLTHDISSNGGYWSAFLTIPGSRVNSTDVTMYTLEVPYKNGSVLPVQVEVTDTGGARAIVIFTPYWVVTSSFLPIQFQHEPRTQQAGSNAELGPLNGEDGLAADQVYEDSKKHREDVSHLSKKHLPTIGLGHSRGVNGVVLGPGTPLRGLTDVLKSSSVGVVSRFTFKKQDEKLSPMGLLHKYLSNATDQDRESDHSGSGLDDQGAPLDVAYRLMQCGYSNSEKRSCHLRLGRDEQWGNYFSLDRVGNTEVDLKTVTDTPSTKQLTQHYSFGVVTAAAEAPFQRTKVVTIVDRLLLVNSVGQSIDVRQFGQDSVFSLKTNDETALWWRPGMQTLQVKLARYGWSWSGKFSVTVEGEIPIRLRNDFDNTVFFVLVEVLKQGPRVCIVFKSGEKFSPYRFENHTLETFKIKQKGQEPVTNLLPYHCSAYAWDEPLAQHMFTIEMAKNGSNVDNQWTTVGTFSFDRLETIARKSNDHLVLKVLAQGPTRVLQISDSRSMKRQESLGGGSPVKRYRSKSVEKSNAELTTPLTSSPSLRPVLFHVLVNIAGLGVSLVDQTPQELIYLSMSGCSVDLAIGEGFQSVDLDLECLQIDNQLWTTPYPSLFYPLLREGASVSPVSRSKHAGVHNNQLKFLSLSVVRDFEYTGIEFLPVFKLTLSPFDINVEGTIIVRIYNMAMSIKDLFVEANSGSAISTKQFDWLEEMSRSSTSAAAAITYQDLRRLEASHRDTPDKSTATTQAATGSTRKTGGGTAPLSIALPNKMESGARRSGLAGTSLASLKNGVGQQRSTLTHTRIKKILESITTLNANVYKPSPKVYIKQLEISEIRLNVSMNATVASDYLHDDKTWWWVAIKQVLMSVGSTLVKLENCPIKFYSFSLGHSYCSEKELLNKMVSNYTGQAIVQSMNVIFSSEWLGNPLLLFRTLSEGLYDFIREPVEGLTKSPSAFVVGILRGTSSLIRRTVASICTTAGHFSAVGQVALLNFGIVEPYAVARPTILDAAEEGGVGSSTALTDLRSRNRTNNAASSLPSTLVKGFVFGARQLFLDPYIGFKIDGIQGALVGTVKGVLGAFARPTYGALGYFSAAMNSLSFELLPQYHAAQKLRIQRFRPPRFLHSPNLPLQVYSVDENVGQELLLRIHKGEYRYEGYVCHSRVKEGYILIMTKMRVMLVNESFEFCELLWQCAIRTILSIEVHYDKNKAASDAVVPYNTNKGSRASPATVKALVEDAKVSVASSPDKKQVAKWNCKLMGEPKLHVYYRPLPSGQEAKATTAAAGASSSERATISASPSAASGEPAGLRFAQKILSMLTHDQLLSVLHQLLILSPSLLSPDITAYLTEAGVDQSLLKAFNNKKKNTSISLRSPNKTSAADSHGFTLSALHGGLGGFASPKRLSHLRSTSSVLSGTSGASSEFFGARHIVDDVDSITE